MFERRLKIFLFTVFAIMLVIAARVLQIQVVQHQKWVDKATKFLVRPSYVETVRGRILDFKGRVIAEDVPCIDAMVDYRAIGTEPDAKWVKEIAATRLVKRLGEEYTKAPKAKRVALAEAETAVVRNDITTMWATLAQCPHMDEQKIEDVRQAIARRVENRRRWIWYRNYQAALDTHDNHKPEPWYSRWLLDDNKPPEMDEFLVTTGDELTPYAVVQAIDADTIAMLGKNLDHFPGLSLQPSTHRFYAYKEAGCHWIGNLAPVTREERASDPNFKDERKRYEYTDLIGRTGIESLAEPLLRGTRGMIERSVGTNVIGKQDFAEPGKDVRTTVDIELQLEIQDIFPHCAVKEHNKPDVIRVLHGAAVVIDVPTGQVRAMASYPTFDPNTLDENYAQLSSNELDKPLLNRATMDVLEPGSTVKPMVGLWGMKSGVLGINEQIQCTGYMMYQGKKQSSGRCWVTQRFAKELAAAGIPVANHPIPSSAPLGHDLSFADALERSCNPFHETIADRLGIDRLTAGFMAFGLGQPTGIGIPERVGRLPNSYTGPNPLNALWSAGIGQGQIGATPLQMADVVATVARGGIWLRPTLLQGTFGEKDLRPAMPTSRPARVDLGLPPAAVAMAHLGMWNVVHGDAGTGKQLDFNEVGVCGKTGTAQAAEFLVPKLDENGRVIPKLDANGQPVLNKYKRPLLQLEPLEVGTVEQPNPIAPWYLGSGSSGKDLAHAWYIGFAPREHPKIAFCVLVEYGGSGGITAAAVAHEVLAACVEHGYLTRER